MHVHVLTLRLHVYMRASLMDILATILARKSARLSVSASCNGNFNQQ